MYVLYLVFKYFQLKTCNELHRGEQEPLIFPPRFGDAMGGSMLSRSCLSWKKNCEVELGRTARGTKEF